MNGLINPDGAGILAVKLSGVGDEDVQLIDVTPLSLGVWCRGDVMAVLIPRNSPIPTKKQRLFSTSIDNITSLAIYVCQGERGNASENYLLGELDLSGFPPAPRGKLGSILSKAEIEKMIADAERFKLEDEAHVKKVMAHRALDQCVSKMRTKIKDYKVRLSLVKVGLNVKDLVSLDHQIKETLEWLDENPDAEQAELEDKKSELYNICIPKKFHHAAKDLLKIIFEYQ
ncbi:unnamed protein product [Lactuca saligna]|uniref:Uncharacterized protein n=1 Tax=Lactuca saligna TaxID=75948 RepID=A0AA35YFW4_LACSI|nr:unnamed protein product [Lactuca saligna]